MGKGREDEQQQVELGRSTAPSYARMIEHISSQIRTLRQASAFSGMNIPQLPTRTSMIGSLLLSVSKRPEDVRG